MGKNNCKGLPIIGFECRCKFYKKEKNSGHCEFESVAFEKNEDFLFTNQNSQLEAMKDIMK